MVTFLKNPTGKNSYSVTGTSGSCSSRSMGWISYLLFIFDLSLLLIYRGFFFFSVSFYDGVVVPEFVLVSLAFAEWQLSILLHHLRQGWSLPSISEPLRERRRAPGFQIEWWRHLLPWRKSHQSFPTDKITQGFAAMMEESVPLQQKCDWPQQSHLGPIWSSHLWLAT